MSQYHDTVREELGDILDKLQEIYRQKCPDTVLLFSTGGSSFNVQDVARKTSGLAPRQGVASLDYDVYTYNILNGNSQAGKLQTEARMGQIDVGYTDIREKNLRFKMRVTFGSRVTDYEAQGSDGNFKPSFSKGMIISILEDTFLK